MTRLSDYQRNSLLLGSAAEHQSIVPRIRTVVVDNHKITLDGLVAGLSFEKDISVVGFATSFNQGLAIVRELEPDVILLDLHLPDAPGPRTTVQEFCRSANASLVIFSAENRNAFVKAALDAGARGYLIKSEAIAKVAATIRSIVREDKIIVSDSLQLIRTDLTKSEAEILKMLARGMKYDDIAAQRHSSPATVRKQCELLILKLKLSNREQLIAWAVQNGYRSLELEQ